MPDIEDGETVEMKGSGRDPYILKNVGGVYSCTCPAWRNQSLGIEKRTCKHIRAYRGDEAEQERLGGEIPPRAVKAKSAKSGDEGEAGGGSEPAILLAHPWKNDVDLTGWWMSEKLDGVRAYWDGKQFISRQGNVFLAPDWFIEDLPSDVVLDGELWLARKQFQRTVSIVRRQDKNDLWKEIRYVVFDAPDVEDVFEARMAYIQEFLDASQPRYAQPHLHVRCKGTEHLREELARVEALGGEGLMLRKPGSKYERCRSFTLLKVKTFHDADARVVEHLPGTGKHSGRLGALQCELANGIRFSVGTGFTDAERENPPPIGSIITFSYQELSDRGVPRFPSYVRLRTDIDSLSDESGAAVHASRPGAGTSSGSVNASSASAASGTSSARATSSASAKTVQPESKPASVKPATGKCSLGPRYFEFVEGTSSKFWEIKVNGTQVIVRFGRIGTDGMVKPKEFPTEAAALKYAEGIIEEKVEKGYEELEQDGAEDGDSDDGAPGDSEDTEADEDAGSAEDDLAEVQNAPVKVAAKTAAHSASAPNTVASGLKPSDLQPGSNPPLVGLAAGKSSSSAASSVPRYFEFVEGPSSKFWEIKVTGTQVIVRFGRIGTDGMVKPKDFPSVEAALKYAEGLIEEKIDKGYEEQEQEQEEAEPEVDEPGTDVSESVSPAHAAAPAAAATSAVAKGAASVTTGATTASPFLVGNQAHGQRSLPADGALAATALAATPAATAAATPAATAAKSASSPPARLSGTTVDCKLGPRYFEFVEGNSSKFWEIKVVANEVIVRFGRIGAEGQVKPKAFPSESAAMQYAHDLIEEKEEKGYQEITAAVDQDDEEETSDDEAGTDGYADDEDSESADIDQPQEDESHDSSSPIVMARATLPTLAPELATSLTGSAASTPTVVPLRAQDSEQCAFGPKYFEMTEDGASKFWEIRVVANVVTLRFGRIGTEGQLKPKSFSSEEVALAYAEEIMDEKVENGYVEKVPPVAVARPALQAAAPVQVEAALLPVQPTAVSSPVHPAAAAAPVESVQEKAPAVISRLSIPPRADETTQTAVGSVTSATKAASAESSATAAQTAKSQASGAEGKPSLGPRYFEFEEGSSRKFWEIQVIANQVIVRFGKTSTSGQTKPKPFPSQGAALTYAQKLIEEKLEKGYQEIDQDQEEDTESEDAREDESVTSSPPPVMAPRAVSNVPSASLSPVRESPSLRAVVSPPAPVPAPAPATVPATPEAASASSSTRSTVVSIASRTATSEKSDEKEDEDSTPEPASDEISFGPVYLECHETEPGKFWEIKVIGRNVFVQAGVIGSRALWQRKPFPSENAAVQYAKAIIAAKSRQSFEEIER